MKTVRFDQCLFYYEGEQIFTGKDKDEIYLFSRVKDERCLGVKISETDLEKIQNGSKDVSSLFTHPKSKLLYPCIAQGKKIQLHFLSTKDLIKEFLCPAKGLFLTPPLDNPADL